MPNSHSVANLHRCFDVVRPTSLTCVQGNRDVLPLYLLEVLAELAEGREPGLWACLIVGHWDRILLAVQLERSLLDFGIGLEELH